MIKSGIVVGVVLYLLSSRGSADEKAKALPPPECLTREGLPLPEAKDPVHFTALAPEERPVPVAYPQPRWPGRVRKCQAPPQVWVQAIITKTGEVCAANLLKPLPAACAVFGESAVEAVRKWKFRPAQRQGVPIAVHYYLGVTFRRDG